MSVPAGDRVGPGPIVCVGAHMQGLFMHVERIPHEGESVRGWGFREPLDGGKVANVAVAAARLGAPVRLMTVIGTDARSARWLHTFEAEHVDTRAIVRLDGPMDVGPALLPPSKIPAVIAVGDLSSKLDAALVHEHAAAIRDASAVICALESPLDGVEAALDLGRQVGATTVLNPSPVTELPEMLTSLVDVLVANEHEAEVLAGAPFDPAGAAAAIRERLPIPTVIVTAGAEGAYAASREGAVAVHVPAPRLPDVADTTGAGDAFLGALVVHLRDGMELVESVTAAVAAASVSCTREHTMPAFPTRAELARFRADVAERGGA
jgi:ribokinase